MSNANTMSKNSTMSNANSLSKNSTMSDANSMSKNSTMSKTNSMSKNSTVSKTNSMSISRDTVICHISYISIVVICMVVDSLDAAIRKVDRVRALDNTGTII